MGEYVSPVIRRSLSNVNGNLKKAVRFGGYFLKILELLSLFMTSLTQIGQIGSHPFFVCQRL